MDKNCIIEFFDEWADGWDAGIVRNEKVIGTILDNCQVREGADVLDVADCTKYTVSPFSNFFGIILSRFPILFYKILPPFPKQKQQFSAA